MGFVDGVERDPEELGAVVHSWIPRSQRDANTCSNVGNRPSVADVLWMRTVGESTPRGLGKYGCMTQVSRSMRTRLNRVVSSYTAICSRSAACAGTWFRT